MAESERIAELEVRYLCRDLQPAWERSEKRIQSYESAVGTGEDQTPPGAYVTAPGTKDCYWARVDDGGGIIANDFVGFAPKGVKVTIRASDAGFQTTGECGAWLPAP